jgi:hypothetical protein
VSEPIRTPEDPRAEAASDRSTPDLTRRGLIAGATAVGAAAVMGAGTRSAQPTAAQSNLIEAALAGVCIDARTLVVGVDEIHNIALHTTTGAGASDMLKYFSERIPATFVYAGIDIERAGLLAGPRGEQIAGRFALIRTGPFPRTEEWTKLVAALDQALRLHAHAPGSLLKLAPYLHQRTGGMIGSLLRLIRCAAIQAVLDGSERITRKALEQIELDLAAQQCAPPKTKAA